MIRRYLRRPRAYIGRGGNPPPFPPPMPDPGDATYYTDFTEFEPGDLFAQGFVLAQSIANPNQIAFVKEGAAGVGRRSSGSTSETRYRLFARDINANNCRALIRARLLAFPNTELPVLYVAINNTLSSTSTLSGIDGYAAVLSDYSGGRARLLTIRRITGGQSSATLASLAVNIKLTRPAFIDIRKIDGLIEARAWSADDEMPDWMLSASNSAYTDGKFGCGNYYKPSFNSGAAIVYDNLIFWDYDE